MRLLRVSTIFRFDTIWPTCTVDLLMQCEPGRSRHQVSLAELLERFVRLLLVPSGEVLKGFAN